MFDYRPGNSPVHLLNPVTKLAVAVGLTVIVFLLPILWGPALLAVALLGVAAVAGAVHASGGRLADRCVCRVVFRRAQIQEGAIQEIE